MALNFSTFGPRPYFLSSHFVSYISHLDASLFALLWEKSLFLMLNFILRNSKMNSINLNSLWIVTFEYLFRLKCQMILYFFVLFISILICFYQSIFFCFLTKIFSFIKSDLMAFQKKRFAIFFQCSVQHEILDARLYSLFTF